MSDLRNLLSVAAALTASAGMVSAQASLNQEGNGCPSPAVFYEQFTGTGSGDLAGVSLHLAYTGNGYLVTTCTTNCFDTNFSNNLSSGDDSLLTNNALGFAFPVPGDSRGTTTAIDISSNGWIGLFTGDFTSSDLSEDLQDFLDESPRLAMVWDDLDPSSAGGVYFDAFPTHAMATWDNVPQWSNNDSNTFQAQFFPNGDLILTWQSGATDDYIAGYSAGGGIPDPGPTDLSAAAPGIFGPFGEPLTLSGSLPMIGQSFTLDVTNIPSNASGGIINFGLTQSNFDLGSVGAPGCTLLNSNDAEIPLSFSGGASSAQAQVPVPNHRALVGAEVNFQSLMLVPGINRLNGIASNRATGPIVQPPVGISVICQGSNSFNSDPTSGFFQVVNSSSLSIDDVTFDWVASSNPAQSTMEFDTDQSGMADEFWNGNASASGCAGTYRNGSDAATGLDYAASQINLVSGCATGSENSGCEATNSTSGSEDYRTLTWRFTPGSFGNGLTFEVDIDTDGGAGIGGDDMEGMVVTIGLSDGTLVRGEVQAVGTDLGRVDL